MNKRKVECLVLAQSFENFWAYYSQSSGQLFRDECKRALLRMLGKYDFICDEEPYYRDPERLNLGEDFDVDAMVRELREWAENEEGSLYPYESWRASSFLIFGLMTGIKSNLLTDLDLEEQPHMTHTTAEAEYTANVVRWRGHLPRSALLDDPQELVNQASNTDTIVLVADIRRSQDLMTYAESSEQFSSLMVKFLRQSRQLLEKHNGFFDKFTGDGFLAYFNEAICKHAGSDYVTEFLDFIAQEQTFAEAHFEDWTGQVRKIPADEVGLALGADSGRVRFQDRGGHLVAVGDPIVWATRMASAAKSGEVLVNNLLYNELTDLEGLDFEKRTGETKTGETFLARALGIAAES